jgi:uncharacterized membrane protein
MLQSSNSVFHSPEAEPLFRGIVRWLHFAAGITWIGLLYFFNLINVPFQKTIDAPTKKAVNPELLGRSLWWFRWGAVVTVLAGLTYYAMFILSSEARGAGLNPWLQLAVWLAIVLVTYAVLYALYQVPALTKDGRVLAAVIAILVIVMTLAIVYIMGNASAVPGKYLGNKSLSIGVGGGMGILMLLNVWGIIWPAQKRILTATTAGTAAPPELARKAFLASRTNAWLSLPMLLFMGTSHGDWIIFGK